MSLLKAIVVLLAAGASAIHIPTQGNKTHSSPNTNGTHIDHPPSAANGTINFNITSPSGIGPAAIPSAFPLGLLNAPTAIKRFQRLLVDSKGDLRTGDALRSQVVFDFNAATATGKGGRVRAANIETFPILTNEDISTTVVFLDPCSMNTPHSHPRATEFLTLVQGQVNTGMILENGLVAAGHGTGEVTATLDTFQGTVFPMGSIHYQFNPTCEPATFIATLNSADPGTSSIAQSYLGLNGDVVSASLGFPDSTINGKDIDAVRSQLPANLVQGVEQCLKRCGL